ncbi:unnamed protein product [Amoebophrya sp. A25]|nr:unnamed protein product [Amoebophrya sp. A25]|eukprot:GSA25T00027606001.1
MAFQSSRSSRLIQKEADGLSLDDLDLTHWMRFLLLYIMHLHEQGPH